MSNYMKISRFDTANGSGIGSVLWMAGCNHNCEGCHNPETHDPKAGKKFDCSTLEELMESLNNPHIKRLTLSGGDPLFPDNRGASTLIAKVFKLTYPNKKLWVYTGYRFEQLKDLDILESIDVLVDGPFVLDKKDISLPFCGSSNQRVIDVPKTLKAGHVVLWEDLYA